MIRWRPDLPAALERARRLEPRESLDWLERPPAGADVLDRSVPVPDGSDLEAAAARVRAYEVHRRAGLRVVGDGPAEPGSSVVLGIPLGPLWGVAACRVAQADDLGFAYLALPGHPEHGAERFWYERDEHGARFRLRAVSRPAWRRSRAAPWAALRVQAVVTQRYLDAGLALARETL